MKTRSHQNRGFLCDAQISCRRPCRRKRGWSIKYNGNNGVVFHLGVDNVFQTPNGRFRHTISHNCSFLPKNTFLTCPFHRDQKSKSVFFPFVRIHLGVVALALTMSILFDTDRTKRLKDRKWNYRSTKVSDTAHIF